MLLDAGRKKRREAEIFRLIDEGFTALGNRDLVVAAQSAECILAIEEDQVDALYLKGQIAHQREHLDPAQDFYEQAILAKPDFIDPYIKLIIVLHTGFRYDDALAVWKLALERVKPSLEQLVDLCSPMVGDFPRQVREVLEPALDPNHTNSRLWTMYQHILH